MRLSEADIYEFAQTVQEANTDPSGQLDESPVLLKTETLLAIKYANLIIFIAASFSLIWAFISYRLVANVDM